jgi:hypothetical protein
MKKLFLVFGLAILFLCSTIDFSDAKGGSSFSGGGRSSSSFSSSSGSKSSSGSWGSSSSSSSVSKPSTPSTPSGSGSSWGTSSGKTADIPTTSNNKSVFSSSGSGPSSSYNTSPSSSTSKSFNWGSSSDTSRVYTPRYVAPSSWSPHYYSTPGYYYGGPSLFDLWWKFELLDTIRDRHDRDTVIRELRSSPEYAVWKAEAAKLSDENKELKDKLQKLEEENKTVVDDVKEDDSTNFMSVILIWGIVLLGVAIIAIVFVKILS